MHETLSAQDGQQGRETIYIGDHSWSNDGLGWLGPVRTDWSHGVEMLKELPFNGTSRCAGQVALSDGMSRKYHFEETPISTLSSSRKSSHTIYVNAADGLIRRHERTGIAESSIKTISTFRFDKTIIIKPPVVSKNRRNERSLQAYNDVVEDADSICRERVISILKKTNSAPPYRYEIKGALWSGVSGIRGEFVPPFSIRYHIDGVPRHGGGGKVIAIDDQIWEKPYKGDWSARANGRLKTNSEFDDMIYPQLFLDRQIFIGLATCPEPRNAVSALTSEYTYQRYRDIDGERVFVGKQRMRVKNESGLPVRFEFLTADGQVRRVESRSYEHDLIIKPPF